MPTREGRAKRAVMKKGKVIDKVTRISGATKVASVVVIGRPARL
jgi:hypothetical protein